MMTQRVSAIRAPECMFLNNNLWYQVVTAVVPKSVTRGYEAKKSGHRPLKELLTKYTCTNSKIDILTGYRLTERQLFDIVHMLF